MWRKNLGSFCTCRSGKLERQGTLYSETVFGCYWTNIRQQQPGCHSSRKLNTLVLVPLDMGRLISKHELHKTMHDSSRLYCAEPPLHMGICTSTMRGGSRQHNFESTKPSRSTLSDPLESQASTFHAAEIYMGSQQYEHQSGNTLCSQIPTYDSQILLSQFSGYNLSTDSAEKAASNFESRDTLQSLVTYHLCRNKCSSSSDKSIILPSSNTSKLFSPDQKVFFAENAASDRGQLPVPSDATQACFVISGLPF